MFELIYPIIYAPTVFIILLYIIIYFIRRRNNLPIPHSCNGISIIVPMWNEQKTIALTIESLFNIKEKYNGNLEIIIVDNNSTDLSVDIVKNLQKKYPELVLAFERENQGKNFAFNRGALCASYDIIVCVDADSYPDPGILEKALNLFRDGKTGAVTAHLIAHSPNKFVEYFQYVEYLFTNFLFTLLGSLDSIYVARGAFSMYRKDIFLNIGGFASDKWVLTEDMEITFRIRKAGYTVRGIREKVLTTVMSGWGALFCQRIRWHRGGFSCFWKHRDMCFNPRFRIFGMFIMPSVLLIQFLTVMMIVLFSIYRVWFFFNEQYSLFMIIRDISIYLIIIISYIFGFIESREKITPLGFGYIMLSIVFYLPIQLIFWLSALFFHIFRFPYRWR